MLREFKDRLKRRDWRIWRETPGFFLPNCDCCDSGGGGLPAACGCDAVPAAWTFTLAGITNSAFCNGISSGGVGGCDAWNRTHVVPVQLIAGGSCIWCCKFTNLHIGLSWEFTCADVSSGIGTAYLVQFTINMGTLGSDTFINLQVIDSRSIGGGGGYSIEYQLVGGVNCLGENVLTKIYDDALCSNWPATVTLAPFTDSTSLIGCNAGYNSYPEDWPAT